MKTIYKILSLVLLLTVFVSCTRDKIETENLDTRENTLFFTSTNAALYVEDGAENTYDITVGSTALAQGTIGYTITVDPSSTAVEGVDFDIISSTELVAGNLVSTFTIEADFENAEIDGKTAVLNLSSNNAKVGVVNQFSIGLFKFCPFEGLNTTSYSARVFAFGDEAPGYDLTLVPVPGTSNQWTISTGWGTNFVFWATGGNPAYAGIWVYSGVIQINEDFTLDVIGDDDQGGPFNGWATGGSGLFSPCTQVMSYTLTQGLFTSPFTVDVVLTPM